MKSYFKITLALFLTMVVPLRSHADEEQERSWLYDPTYVATATKVSCDRVLKTLAGLRKSDLAKSAGAGLVLAGGWIWNDGRYSTQRERFLETSTFERSSFSADFLLQALFDDDEKVRILAEEVSRDLIDNNKRREILSSLHNIYATNNPDHIRTRAYSLIQAIPY